MNETISTTMPSKGDDEHANADRTGLDHHAGNDKPSADIDLIMRIPVTLQVVIGSARLPVSELMEFGRDSIIPLDRHVGDPVDLVVNGRIVARGELVLMEDEGSQFGVSITETVGLPEGCQSAS